MLAVKYLAKIKQAQEAAAADLAQADSELAAAASPAPGSDSAAGGQTSTMSHQQHSMRTAPLGGSMDEGAQLGLDSPTQDPSSTAAAAAATTVPDPPAVPATIADTDKDRMEKEIAGGRT